jgi:hypothetical protein
MMPPSFHGRMLCRAAEKLRGVPQLAVALEVSESTLRRWMSGESTPPESVLQASMEIFVDGRRPPRRKLPPARKGTRRVADI